MNEFREKYAKVIQRAHTHAEHTQTDGWQELFQQRNADDVRKRKLFADRLSSFAKSVLKPELVTLLEDLKPLTEVKNQLRDHIVERMSWEEQIVSSISSIVEEAQKCIDDYRSRAEREERMHTLHANGLETAMEEAIKQAPVVTWDAKDGVVRVNEKDVG